MPTSKPKPGASKTGAKTSAAGKPASDAKQPQTAVSSAKTAAPAATAAPAKPTVAPTKAADEMPRAITAKDAKAAAEKKPARDVKATVKTDDPVDFKDASQAALLELIAEARAEDKPVKLHQLGKVMAQGQKFSASDAKAITDIVLDSLVEVMKAEQMVVFPNGMKIKRLRGSERENVDVHILQLREPKDDE